MQRSSKPFGQTLTAILEEHDISLHELSRRTRRHDNWGAVMTFSNLIHGQIAPTMNAIESIAKALQIQPEVFAEYRLLKARHALTPSALSRNYRTGLKKALANLGE